MVLIRVTVVRYDDIFYHKHDEKTHLLYAFVSIVTQLSFSLSTHTYLTLGAHAQRGVVCLVCLSVCVSMLILALQATRRPISDTSGVRTTGAWKIKGRFSSNDCVRERQIGTVADHVAWSNPSTSGAHAYTRRDQRSMLASSPRGVRHGLLWRARFVISNWFLLIFRFPRDFSDFQISAWFLPISKRFPVISRYLLNSKLISRSLEGFITVHSQNSSSL